MNTKPRLAVFALLSLSFGLFFAAGYFTHAHFGANEAPFPILAEAHQVLRNHTLYDLPEAQELEYGMIRGMLSAYGDPHTRFVEPAQHELDSDNLEGRYGGIGWSFASTAASGDHR